MVKKINRKKFTEMVKQQVEERRNHKWIIVQGYLGENPHHNITTTRYCTRCGCLKIEGGSQDLVFYCPTEYDGATPNSEVCFDLESYKMDYADERIADERYNRSVFGTD